MKTILSNSESFALGHLLHDYPDDLTYNSILELIEKEEDMPLCNKTVMPCEAYEDLYTDNLISRIEQLKEEFEFHCKKG